MLLDFADVQVAGDTEQRLAQFEVSVLTVEELEAVYQRGRNDQRCVGELVRIADQKAWAILDRRGHEIKLEAQARQRLRHDSSLISRAFTDRLESSLRRFLSRAQPSFGRVLLVESGSRHIAERAIQMISTRAAGAVIDVVTCYPGSPAALCEGGSVFRVSDFQGRPGRSRLLGQLQSRGYTVIAIVCSAEPIMTKWKWWIAANLSVKIVVINENGDWFPIDCPHWRTLLRFVLFRAGLSGGDTVGSFGRFIAFPFMLLYLLVFAAWVHARRLVRVWFRREAHG
jgi:hypothetical protein